MISVYNCAWSSATKIAKHSRTQKIYHTILTTRKQSIKSYLSKSGTRTVNIKLTTRTTTHFWVGDLQLKLVPQRRKSWFPQITLHWTGWLSPSIMVQGGIVTKCRAVICNDHMVLLWSANSALTPSNHSADINSVFYCKPPSLKTHSGATYSVAPLCDAH